MVGDRAFALRDTQTGRIASAKRPQMWRQMLLAGARMAQGAAIITLPGGREIRSDDAGASEALSRFLGRDVELLSERAADASLERALPEEVAASDEAAAVGFTVSTLGQGAPDGAFVDFAPVHVLTRSSLQAIHPEGGDAAARYRPNILLDDATLPFSENDWAGRTIRIGQVELAIIVPTPRCAVPALQHGALDRAPKLLRTLAERNMVDSPDFGRQPCLGAYARVVTPGRVAEGDTAVLG